MVGRVCVALSGPDMLQDVELHLPRCLFFEFRLDSLPDPASVLDGLKHLLQQEPNVTAIATCRRAEYGGGFHGSAHEQLRILTEAAQAGCRLADIELETAEDLGSSILNTLRAAGAAVIVSWHDFYATPDVSAVFHRIEADKPDFIKIVPTAQSLRDALRLIDLLEQHSGNGRLIAMSMGQKGVLTRILGPRFGSAFTFASPDNNKGTAPGQIPFTTLHDLYRVERITPDTRLYAVAGEPIGASLSPLMHNTAFKTAGMDAVYLPLETSDADGLRDTIRRLGIRGLSITMPLKEAVLPLLAHRDASVDHMAACNTLLHQPDGSLAGFNTDMQGIIGPLQRRTALQGKHVLILGAGGAARAAVFGLRDAGVEVSLLNRTPERAQILAHEAGAQVMPREALHTTRFDILINSTPYGMRGKDIDPPITAEEMDCDLFFDLVYNPVETPLMRMAASKGIATIPGIEMFVAQGVRQFELWTGQPAPVDAMQHAVMDALAAHRK